MWWLGIAKSAHTITLQSKNRRKVIRKCASCWRTTSICILREPQLINDLRPWFGCIAKCGTADGFSGQEQKCAFQQQQSHIDDAQQIASNDANDYRIDAECDAATENLTSGNEVEYMRFSLWRSVHCIVTWNMMLIVALWMLFFRIFGFIFTHHGIEFNGKCCGRVRLWLSQLKHFCFDSSYQTVLGFRSMLSRPVPVCACICVTHTEQRFIVHGVHWNFFWLCIRWIEAKSKNLISKQKKTIWFRLLIAIKCVVSVQVRNNQYGDNNNMKHVSQMNNNSDLNLSSFFTNIFHFIKY